MPGNFVMVSGYEGLSKTILESRTNEDLEGFCSVSPDQCCDLHSVTRNATKSHLVQHCPQWDLQLLYLLYLVYVSVVASVLLNCQQTP